jgi:alpha-L-fucosidase
MTMNDTWGYKSFDQNWKSAETLIRTLIDIASKGGNFLLNVGPTAEGEIPAASVERLERMGTWLRKNGESVYDTTAGPFRHLDFEGRCTVRGDRLYLHVFDWPAERKLTLNGVRNRATFAQSLENYPLSLSTGDSPRPSDLTSFGIEQDGETVTIRLPAEPADPIASVIVVQLDGPPDIDTTFVIRQADDGSLRLPARLAEVHGYTARYESGHGKDNIGFWTEASDWVSWPLRVDHGGQFEVHLTQATDAGTGGSEFAVEVAAERLTGTVRETGSWTAFETTVLGRVRIPAGEHACAVRAVSKPGLAVMNLKQIELRRVAD